MYDTYLLMYRLPPVGGTMPMERYILWKLGRLVWRSYGVATISRLLKNIGLFCKRAL